MENPFKKHAVKAKKKYDKEHKGERFKRVPHPTIPRTTILIKIKDD